MVKRKNRCKLETPRKQYSPNQCGLFAIRGRQQLLDRLRWKGTFDELRLLARNTENYQCWTDEGRAIQAPTEDLKHIHTRIATLLRRILPPTYRQSGVRGRSFLTNAQAHASPSPSVRLDIRRFYPSTTFQNVFRFFTEDMRCARDIAHLLADLCCFRRRHLPTGGRHSEVLAFFCHKKIFDALQERATARGGLMTIYVDDIVLTMPDASLTDLEWCRRLFKRHGLEIHPGKSRVFGTNEPKTVTGVTIDRGTLRATRRQHRMVRKRSMELKVETDTVKAAIIARRLIGHLDHIAQIEPGIKSKAVGNRNRLMPILHPPTSGAN